MILSSEVQRTYTLEFNEAERNSLLSALGHCIHHLPSRETLAERGAHSLAMLDFAILAIDVLSRVKV